MRNGRRIASITAMTLALAGCHVSLTPAAREADQRARIAGLAMLRSNNDIPTRDAAWLVVGQVGNTTIDALRATGTTWSGEVVLRIRVERDPGQFSSSTAVRCYRYVLRHRVRDYEPQRLGRCPTGRPLVLQAPPPPPSLPPGALDLLTKTLASLDPTTRGSADGVASAVRGAFAGSDGRVETTVVPGGVIGVAVSAGRDCLAARLVPGEPPDVWSLPRVVFQPGELGCSAQAFASGLGKTPPH